MADRRKSHLDALERRITGAKKIALFGHRAVGKTTLLAMFYREASAGRVPGVRMAAIGPATAEYLAERIAQIEGGEPLAGTVAETELKLRLYHGPARFDLIVKDYQGEHVALGSDAPIRDFFADCDAVFLCLDPEASDRPAARRVRQQEVEDLLERYIERSDDGTAGRPVALLVTKYDRVLDRGGPPPDEVEDFVDSRYGMTRHALATHAPHSAMFAVSAYGPGVDGDGRPPAELHPMGLDGPLGWLAEQLEVADREAIEWLWDLAPDDPKRMAKCVKAFDRRYPRSPHGLEFRRKLRRLKTKHRVRKALKLVAFLALIAGGLAGYDAWEYRAALQFEKGDNPPALVERKWDEFLLWHPTHSIFFPGEARIAREHRVESSLLARTDRAVAGDPNQATDQELRTLKVESPRAAPAIAKLEQAIDVQKHEQAWKSLRVADLVAIQDPEAHLTKLRAFLSEFPDTTHKAEAVAMVGLLEAKVENRRDRDDLQALDRMEHDATLPDARLPELIERGQAFLTERKDSRYRDDVKDFIDRLARRIDDQDIARARLASREQPTNFLVRKQRYRDYLKAHAEGGRFVGEANAAIDAIERERELYLYRQAYDHQLAHSKDIPVVAAKLKTYLDSYPEGKFARDARAYVGWWEKISQPADYRVVLRRGEVEPDVGKYLSGGGPDLSVEVYVAGVKYGPSPIAKDTYKPIWDWEIPRPVRWKYGEQVSIRIFDNDWSVTPVFTFGTDQGDNLAMKMLSGTVRPSKGGKTMITFDSNFAIPGLSKPE